MMKLMQIRARINRIMLKTPRAQIPTKQTTVFKFECVWFLAMLYGKYIDLGVCKRDNIKE